jgi:hypothetical protein
VFFNKFVTFLKSQILVLHFVNPLERRLLGVFCLAYLAADPLPLVVVGGLWFHPDMPDSDRSGFCKLGSVPTGFAHLLLLHTLGRRKVPRHTVAITWRLDATHFTTWMQPSVGPDIFWSSWTLINV